MGNFKKISKKMHYFVREPRNNKKECHSTVLRIFVQDFS